MAAVSARMQRAELGDEAIEELVTLYCQAWNEPDVARRFALLQRVFAKDGVYSDPTVHLTGVAELAAHIGKVAERYPNSRIVRTSLVDAHHGTLRFTWHKRLADGKPLPESIDICTLSPDGKLQLVVGFFGPVVARSET